MICCKCDECMSHLNFVNTFLSIEKHLRLSTFVSSFFIVVEINSEVEETVSGVLLLVVAPYMVCWKVDVSHSSDSLLTVVSFPTCLFESCGVVAFQNKRLSENYCIFGTLEDIIVFPKRFVTNKQVNVVSWLEPRFWACCNFCTIIYAMLNVPLNVWNNYSSVK